MAKFNTCLSLLNPAYGPDADTIAGLSVVCPASANKIIKAGAATNPGELAQLINQYNLANETRCGGNSLTTMIVGHGSYNQTAIGHHNNAVVDTEMAAILSKLEELYENGCHNITVLFASCGSAAALRGVQLDITPDPIETFNVYGAVAENCLMPELIGVQPNQLPNNASFANVTEDMIPQQEDNVEENLVPSQEENLKTTLLDI